VLNPPFCIPILQQLVAAVGSFCQTLGILEGRADPVDANLERQQRKKCSQAETQCAWRKSNEIFEYYQSNILTYL